MAAHAQMNQEGEALRKLQDDELAPARQAADFQFADFPREPSGPGRGDGFTPENPRPDDAFSGHAGGPQVAHDGFDFGQFGHGERSGVRGQATGDRQQESKGNR